MEPNNLSLSVLPLSALLDQFREDGEVTEASESVYDYFNDNYHWGDTDHALVRASKILADGAPAILGTGCLSDHVFSSLVKLLRDVEEKNPGVFIDLAA
jgi:hypothetical protein